MMDHKQPTIATLATRHPMELALEQARAAALGGEVPVGAVVIGPDRQILGRAGNRTERDKDPSAHAELLALRQAAQTAGQWRLTDCDLYVTLEPCPMCAHAISLFRIKRLIYGAHDPKGGGVVNGARIFQASSCHHHPSIAGGVGESESAALLQAFFQRLRDERRPDPRDTTSG